MPPTSLYRSEVLEAKRNRWLGSLILRQPMSHWAMTWLALGAVAIAIAFMYVGEYARKIRIEGHLIDTPAQAHASAGNADGTDAGLEAELLIPESLLASIAIGNDVLLRYPAYPHQRYGQYRGRIVAISRQPAPSARADPIDPSAGRAQASYRATVALERQHVHDDRGNERDLRPGLDVQADIVLEKHRLYEWLLEPFARLRDRITR